MIGHIERGSGFSSFKLGVDELPSWFKEIMASSEDIFVTKDGLLIKFHDREATIPLGTNIVRCHFDSLYFMDDKTLNDTFGCYESLKDEEEEGLDAIT